MSDTVSLSSGQKDMALEMLDELDDESHPLDFVDEWRASPNVWEMEYEDLGCQYVPVSQIVGTDNHNTDRLVSGRLERVLKWLVEGEFEKEVRFPPDLIVVDGKYFVSSDGNHRAIAHKALGIEKMYADVTRFYHS